MEVFTRVLAQAESNDAIQGINISRKAPQVTYLLFADDCLIFVKADMHNVNNILEIINKFSVISGQQINFQKSAFSKHLPPRHCRMLLRRLKMKQMSLDEKYLGIPLFLKRKKTLSFSSLVNNMKSRLKKWNGKFFNQSGRSFMVKHVLNDLPSHHMGVFKIPETTVREMDKVQRDYWWKKPQGGGVYITRWPKMCRD
ncbi:uncharacterized protein LOC113324442 [Papaver somniferum]|uniref:uncharacterized protein LOC113324442 n=1 Tax=Papaver somniferum TaxID=3469 RepID=UPI000E6F4797|nr:uncharacterized protein LOC113324442 [Papaver somniferum]